MTEDAGLEKFVSMFGGKKRRERGGKSEQGFTFEMAVERFKLFASVGKEGQEPKASFREGNTIVLSDLPPGTILREKFVRQQASVLTDDEQELFDDVKEYGIELNEEKADLEAEYTWWCVGDYNEKKGELTLFDSYPNPDRENRQGYLPYRSLVYKFFEPSSQKMFFGERVIKSDKKKKVQFEVGKPGVILDDALESTSLRKETVEAFRKTRSTLEVDVMQFGVREKAKEKVRKPSGLRSLVPQREPIAG